MVGPGSLMVEVTVGGVVVGVTRVVAVDVVRYLLQYWEAEAVLDGLRRARRQLSAWQVARTKRLAGVGLLRTGRARAEKRREERSGVYFWIGTAKGYVESEEETLALVASEQNDR